MVDKQQVFNLNEVQKNKYSYLSDNDKPLIKPYFDESDNEALNLLFDAAARKDIEQQMKTKSCITSQVIFFVQVYLDLVKDFKIGIIGCGIIGKSVLNALAFLLGWIEPNNIHISTRRPENLSKYEDIGFNIYFDNDKLIEQCDVIILCFPPSLDNWAIVELRDSIHARQQNSSRPFQPFIISVVANLYINKLSKLLMTNRIYARTHIALKEQLDTELQFGQQLFQQKDLIQQLLVSFQFIFKGDKLKEEEEFKLSEVDSSIKLTLLGKEVNSLDDPDLIDVAASQYQERSTNYRNIMNEILRVNKQ